MFEAQKNKVSHCFYCFHVDGMHVCKTLFYLSFLCFILCLIHTHIFIMEYDLAIKKDGIMSLAAIPMEPEVH